MRISTSFMVIRAGPMRAKLVIFDLDGTLLDTGAQSLLSILNMVSALVEYDQD